MHQGVVRVIPVAHAIDIENRFSKLACLKWVAINQTIAETDFQGSGRRQGKALHEGTRGRMGTRHKPIIESAYHHLHSSSRKPTRRIDNPCRICGLVCPEGIGHEDKPSPPALQTDINSDVRTPETPLVNLDRNGIYPCHQHPGHVQLHIVICRLVAVLGEGVGIDRGVRHEDRSHLYSVDIDDAAIVHRQIRNPVSLGSLLCGEGEGVPEQVGGDHVLTVGSITNPKEKVGSVRRKGLYNATLQRERSGQPGPDAR